VQAFEDFIDQAIRQQGFNLAFRRQVFEYLEDEQLADVVQQAGKKRVFRQ